ncbi:quinone oxidoreductase family protein [Cucumibacter marinus]|uniref:quinone oxidoreductase family protein n=1 Tax=Cucumibacter marinus TaxID=1121252 RepID=UPI0004285B58|nr:quinone oxidoreductase [Cucumibacter marinus]
MSKSVIIREFGGPEVMQFEEVEIGAPGPGEIQVRHEAIGLNFIDVYHRTGLYPNPLPFTPGQEGAGEVVAVGEGATEFSVGDRVTYSGALGSYSELRNLKAELAVKLPEGVSEEIAAASTLKGLTVYHLLHSTYALQPGETVLVMAAAGGVGQLLCQWAKHIGATVIGCAGSPEKVALARANGCDHAIDYSAQDYRIEVQKLTGGQGVDVVYDSVGKATFMSSLDCLKPRGMMVSFGNATGPVSIDNLGVLAQKGSLYVCRPTSGTYTATREALVESCDALFSAIQTGIIKPKVNQRFALSDAQEAHRALEARQTTGASILVP